MRFALVAGEASGDILGAALIRSLRRHYPGAEFVGITGPHMREAGCQTLAGIDQLSLMGVAEVLSRAPSILRLRRTILRQLQASPLTALIAIDSPDFNLPLERQMHRRGIKTVHLVSPTVWAWRESRVRTIAKAVDLMLCLFPFEPTFYKHRGMPETFRVEFIGHPLAELLASPLSRKQARELLGIPEERPVIAVLPGSRSGEVRYLAAPFVDTAARLASTVEDPLFLVPLANPSLRAPFEAVIAARAPHVEWRVLDRRAHEVMCAADVVLLASGTATLECLLLDRPMVVGYRVSGFTARLLKLTGLLKVDRFSLPNLLCEDAPVPEFIQDDVKPERMAESVRMLLADERLRKRQTDAFKSVRAALQRNAADRAADSIAQLCESVSNSSAHASI